MANAYLPDIPPVDAETPISELLGIVASAPCGLPVVDADARYLGVISRASLLQTLDRES